MHLRKKRGFSKCHSANCLVCSYAMLQDKRFSKKTIKPKKHVKWEIKKKFTCDSKNVIYAIRCQKCLKLYIGETGRKIKQRINEHMSKIRKNNLVNSVSRHFNQKGHSLHDFEWVVLGSPFVQGKYFRRRLECSLILSFDTFSPKGLN